MGVVGTQTFKSPFWAVWIVLENSTTNAVDFVNGFDHTELYSASHFKFYNATLSQTQGNAVNISMYNRQSVV